jgi:uncharacterized protein (TIGR04255 family)
LNPGDDFEAPPVFEAVMGIEFGPLPISLTSLAGLHPKVATQYPGTNEAPALPPTVIGARPGVINLNFGLTTGPPPVRLWFLTAAGDYLVQLQKDRLVLNWRKVEGGSDYPRYEAFRARFEDLLQLFFEHLESLGVGPIVVTAVEFASAPPHDIYAIFHDLEEPMPGKEVEIRFQTVRDLTALDGSVRGRLAVQSEPVREGDQNTFRMSITTHFFPDGMLEHDSVVQLFDAAHAASRAAFGALTTAKMKEQWGLR